MNVPDKRKHGRQPGPSESVLLQVAKAFLFELEDGMTFEQAARISTGSQSGPSRLHTYRQRYPRHIRQLREHIKRELAIEAACDLMTDLRYLAECYVDKLIEETLNQPGYRQARKAITDNRALVVDEVIFLAARSLNKLRESKEWRESDEQTIDRLITQVWAPSIREALKHGPKSLT